MQFRFHIKNVSIVILIILNLTILFPCLCCEHFMADTDLIALLRVSHPHKILFMVDYTSNYIGSSLVFKIKYEDYVLWNHM